MVLALVAACSGPSSAGNTALDDAGQAGDAGQVDSTAVTGTYSGMAVPTNASIGLYGVATAAGTYAGVIITNVDTACALFKSAADPQTAGINVPNTVQLNLQVQASTAGGAVPVPPGTYPVTESSPYFVHAGIEVTDAACMNSSITSDATGGTIELLTVSADTITGRFDLTFPSGDHIQGQFHAPVCTFDLNALEQNGLTGCGSTDGGTD